MNDEDTIAQLERDIALLRQRVGELEAERSDGARAREALQRSEERFQRIFRASPVAVVISSMDEGRYLEINQHCADFWGYTREEVIGRTSGELRIWANPADRTRIGQLLATQTFARDQEVMFRMKGGAILTALASFEVIDLDGVSCVLTMCQDITERQRLKAGLETLYHEARDAVRSRDEFLSAAVHELRTPVTTLRGYTQLLTRAVERDRQVDHDRLHKSLNVIDSQAGRLVRFFDRLLDLAQVQSGQLTLNSRATDLTALAARVTAAAGAMTGSTTLHVLPSPAINAFVDPILMEHVLMHLLDNAVRYTPAGTHVEIAITTREADGVQISVTDEGPGISADQHPFIFDRFYRGRGRADGGGLGVGLYVAHEIVAAHGGSLTVEAPSTGGTRFVIWLPHEGGGAANRGEVL